MSEEHVSNRACILTTDDGRQRIVRIDQTAAPFGEFFDEPSRAFLREDPEGFWAGFMMAREAGAAADVEPGFEVRRAEARAFAPPPGAKACLWFTHDETSADRRINTQDLRCALYDPADDVWEEFSFEYMEFRQPGVPPDPGFAADAERVARTLRFGPPRA